LVSYVVDEYGKVTDVSVVNGIGAGCDEEAVRVIKGMPRWKPGHQNGEGIRVEYKIPIIFELGRKRSESEQQKEGNE
jgi:periplasmic protein TonB